MTLRDEVGVGRLAGLEALRDVIAAEIEAGPPEWSGKGPAPVSQTATLARQLRETLREIEELRAKVRKGSVVDELEDARKNRLSKAEGAVPARASGGKRRSGGR